MNSLRFQISAVLIIIAGFAMIMPHNSKSLRELDPDEMIEIIDSPEKFITVDEVALHIIREDSSIQLIDVRSQDQYMTSHIPGALNIQLGSLIVPEYAGYLEEPGKSTVFYSNGSILATEAYMITQQSGYSNSRIMKGGMNEWYNIVMNSEFTGEKITAAENAIFEARFRAKNYFTQMNSLPDSLKSAFLEIKMKKEAELVGGCE
jgi:rhodanese-related sulfurtransferase